MPNGRRAYNGFFFDRSEKHASNNNRMFYNNNKQFYVDYKRKAPNSSPKIDAEDLVRARNDGICAGISLTWIIGVCSNVDAALNLNSDSFTPYFQNVLRFQGAYFQNTYTMCYKKMQFMTIQISITLSPL